MECGGVSFPSVRVMSVEGLCPLLIKISFLKWRFSRILSELVLVYTLRSSPTPHPHNDHVSSANLRQSEEHSVTNRGGRGDALAVRPAS